MIDAAPPRIIEKLPDYFHPDRGDDVPAQMLGAKILRIGTLPASSRIEGGGLVIEYCPARTASARRIVFEFNELGMWVDSDGPILSSPNGSPPEKG
jgi:hypothetical protein